MPRLRFSDVEIIAAFALFLGLIVFWRIAGLGTVVALAAMTDLAITRVQVKRARRPAPVRRTRV